jgi:hypothetical protein
VEFPEFVKVNGGAPSLQYFRMTLSGLAGVECFPFPISKGPAFTLRSAELTSKPFDYALRSELRVEDSGQAPSPSTGNPLLQQISLRNTGLYLGNQMIS